MNHLKLIHQFIKENRNPDEVPETGYPFITISRQAGAGGHLLSYVITTDMLNMGKHSELFRGWHVFDKQLCEIVAQDPDLQDSVDAVLKERYQSEFSDFMDSLFSGYSKQYLLYKRTFKVVRMLAAIGKVIIVGRGGACVTHDMKQGVHARLVAPEAHRLRWMMNKFKITRDEAHRAIDKQDADRRKLMRTFFNKDIDDPLLYDTVWNTATVELHDISHALIQIVLSRAAKLEI